MYFFLTVIVYGVFFLVHVYLRSNQPVDPMSGRVGKAANGGTASTGAPVVLDLVARLQCVQDSLKRAWQLKDVTSINQLLLEFQRTVQELANPLERFRSAGIMVP